MYDSVSLSPVNAVNVVTRLDPLSRAHCINIPFHEQPSVAFVFSSSALSHFLTLCQKKIDLCTRAITAPDHFYTRPNHLCLLVDHRTSPNVNRDRRQPGESQYLTFWLSWQFLHFRGVSFLRHALLICLFFHFVLFCFFWQMHHLIPSRYDSYSLQKGKVME